MSRANDIFRKSKLRDEEELNQQAADNSASPQSKCINKIPYKTVEDAQAAVIYFKHKYGGEQRIYTCRFCGEFHLTKKR